MRPRTTVIVEDDSKIDYLLTHLALGVAIPRWYLAKTPTIRGPFVEIMRCPIIC